MPERALHSPGGVRILDEPSAGDDDRHQRAEPEASDERGAHELMVEGARMVPEEVADGAERRCPDRGTGDIEQREAPRVHLRDTGDERYEHSHDRNESAEEDRARAVTGEEAVGALERPRATVGVALEE